MDMKRLLRTTAATILVIALVLSSISCGTSDAPSNVSDQTAYAGTGSTQESTDNAKSSEEQSLDQKEQIKTVWYDIKDLNLAMEVPEDFKLKAAKKKGDFEGSNDRIKITIKRWNRVSYPKAKDLGNLVTEVTGRKVKIIKRGGRRIVKALGLSNSIRYYSISSNGDDYVITIKVNKEKNKGLKFKDVKDEAQTIEKSFRMASRIPEGSKTIKIAKTKFPSFNKLVLVNYSHKIPDGWMDKVDIVKAVNTRGNKVRAERTAYKAYLKLKHDLEANNGIHIDIDFGLRTVKEQKKILDDYTKQYGASYANRYVAQPGTSEHHTGLALDIYLIINGNNVYLNEEMEKYPKIWSKIHAKLAKYGFILRYPKNGNGRNTGYPYEPWHIRYVGKKAAKKIMAKQPGYTLEMYLS